QPTPRKGAEEDRPSTPNSSYPLSVIFIGKSNPPSSILLAKSVANCCPSGLVSPTRFLNSVFFCSSVKSERSLPSGRMMSERRTRYALPFRLAVVGHPVGHRRRDVERLVP